MSTADKPVAPRKLGVRRRKTESAGNTPLDHMPALAKSLMTLIGPRTLRGMPSPSPQRSKRRVTLHNALNILITLSALLVATILATGCAQLGDGILECSQSFIDPSYTVYVVAALGALKIVVISPAAATGFRLGEASAAGRK
jgi:hypothetical protein